MKNRDISKLQKNRSIYFKIGMILSLTFTIYAFNWTTYVPQSENFEVFDLPPEIEIDVIRTQDKKVILPPPVVSISDDIIIDDQPEYTNLPEPQPLENPAKATTNTKVDFQGNNEPPVPVPQIIRPKMPEPTVSEIFKIVEEMPRFPGCEKEELTKKEKENCANKELLNYVFSKIKYPPIARESTIEGLVVVRFIVEKDGSISDATVVRDIGGGCGQEALRVVNSMPKWIPGKQRNRPVRVQFNLPVRFKLK